MKSEAAVYMAAVLEYIVAEVANFFMLILVTHKLSRPLTFYCGKRINTRVVRSDINFKIQRDPLDFLVPIDL